MTGMCYHIHLYLYWLWWNLANFLHGCLQTSVLQISTSQVDFTVSHHTWLKIFSMLNIYCFLLTWISWHASFFNFFYTNKCMSLFIIRKNKF
jgi:hypothetical protein